MCPSPKSKGRVGILRYFTLQVKLAYLLFQPECYCLLAVQAYLQIEFAQLDFELQLHLLFQMKPDLINKIKTGLL